MDERVSWQWHAVADINVGERFRKDMGDIAGLAASIADLGLLHPIVITPAGELIAGERRLTAVRSLGWTEVPVRVVDILKIIRGEMAENFARKDFLPSEAVAIAEAVEAGEKAAAKERQREHGGTAPGKHSAQVGQSVPSAEVVAAMVEAPLPEKKKPNRTADNVASIAGMKRTTLEKARAIVTAAKAEPEVFAKLKDDMDRTGRVDGPFKRLNVIKKAVAIRAEPPPLPGRGPYRVAVADPPWPYETRQDDPSHRAAFPYPTMSIDEICAMQVAGIMHEDSILWLWTTNHHMPHAYRVADAWGFRVVTILTWAKNKIGYGDWLRGQTEHALMCVRGKPTVEVGAHSTLLVADVPPRHSQKPDEFYELVEALCPAPRYAELFSRRDRPNWDGHGDEASRSEADEPNLEHEANDNEQS